MKKILCQNFKFTEDSKLKMMGNVIFLYYAGYKGAKMPQFNNKIMIASSQIDFLCHNLKDSARK